MRVVYLECKYPDCELAFLAVDEGNPFQNATEICLNHQREFGHNRWYAFEWHEHEPVT